MLQRTICATAQLIIPGTSAGLVAASQTETFCGKYLNTLDGDKKSGVVTCKFKSLVTNFSKFQNNKLGQLNNKESFFHK